MGFAMSLACLDAPLNDVAPLTRSKSGVKQRRQTQTSVWQCLVVAEDDYRREMLARSAREQGWQPLLCADAGQAAVELGRTRFGLAMVDLEGFDGFTPDGYRQLAEQISHGGGPLMMVCGNEGDALEEIWARQLGVWLYLPGVDETCDLGMLCGEARKVNEKLRPELTEFRQATGKLARTA